MNETIVVVNALLYCILFIQVWRKNRKFGVAEVLLSIYVIVAIACVFNYSLSHQNWYLNILDLIYLFVVVSIFIMPVSKDSEVEVTSPPITNFNLYKKIAWGYIIISLYSCTVNIPQVYLILQNPEWSKLYEQAHDTIESNIYIKMANLFFHFRFLGIVLFFSFLSYKHVKKIFILILGVSAFLPIVLVTMMQASRGGVVSLLISIYLSFRMFDQIISVKAKRVLYKISLCCIPLAIVYFIAVSNSRFEDGASGYESSNHAFISYLGQSMLHFDNGIMGSVYSYGHGGYMFYDKQLIENIKGDNVNTGFMTFVGCLYLDYGAFGTFLIAIVVSLIMRKFLINNKRGVPECFILLYYIMFIFNGVFVLGYGYGNQWIESILIYILLKFAEKTFRKNTIQCRS